MRTVFIVIWIVFFSTFFSCSPEEQEMNIDSKIEMDFSLIDKTDMVMAQDILQLINNHRDSVNKGRLKFGSDLATIYSVTHALYMIDEGKISHDNFIDRSNGLKESGAISVGENVGFGYTFADDIVNAWINSPAHLSVLEGNYTHVSFGIVKDHRGVYFFSTLFYR